MNQEDRLKIIIEEIAKSHKEIAKELGYSRAQSISDNLKSGKATNKFIVAICSTYGYNPEWVKHGSEPMRMNTSLSVTDKIRNKKLFDSTPKGLVIVPIKAQANYAKHSNETIFQDQLQRTFLPDNPYDGDNFRMFQVEGDSMEYIDDKTGRATGIEDGSWVIAQKVPQEDWRQNLKKYYVHIIVTGNRITIKRILQDNPDEIVLHADNDDYGQERLSLSEVKEIWLFKRKLEYSVPPPRRIEIKV